MYTRQELEKQLEEMGIPREGTLLVHSSMRAIGPVEGGAETVLDALSAWMEPGLLVFPTHTWQQINGENPVYDPLGEPACVGLLPNLFLKRPGVVRSLHPTHSVAALGAEAEEFTRGEELLDTPCPRRGCWGKLLDRSARILFLGCSLKSNTFLHGVEEWNGVPNRIGAACQNLAIRLPSGTLYPRPMHRHEHPGLAVSQSYDKMEGPFLALGAAKRGRFGDAPCVLGDAAKMAALTTDYLRRNIHLFDDETPVPEDWYH